MFDKNIIKDLIDKSVDKNSQEIQDSFDIDEDGFRIILYFQKNILTYNEFNDYLKKENYLNQDINIRICNNKEIKINDEMLMKNFIRIQTSYVLKKDSIEETYYILENDNKLFMYHQIDGKPKALINKKNELNENIFDSIFKELINKYKSLGFMKEQY